MVQSNLLQEIQGKINNAYISAFSTVAKHIWLQYWPYVIIFIIIIIAGIILQILMLRSGRHNRLSPGFNRLVGSLTYFFFFGLLFIITYWTFGAQIVDELWLAIFGAIAFPVTGIFLRWIKFWYYKK